MTDASEDKGNRLVPEAPPLGERLRLLLDTDAGTEIDDLYAMALLLASPDRFALEGFVATHFAASHSRGGPESIEASYQAVLKMLELAGAAGKYPVLRGAHPMQYPYYPSKGDGVDFIIERARQGSEEDPLWVVGIGAATNLASAVLTDPGIIPRVRYVFHARSSHTWPERSVQYNVRGDVLAAQALLTSQVPLVWFDTGTHLCCSFEETAERLAPTGSMGEYIHEFRRRKEYWMTTEKGFYDMADIAWLIKPDLCRQEVVPAPTMDHYMFFNHERTHGPMRRVYDIDSEPAWELLFERLARHGSHAGA